MEQPVKEKSKAIDIFLIVMVSFCVLISLVVMFVKASGLID
ncbi:MULTISPECIES: hypothetical protein [Dehalococcoides]|jgi:hypothetical protein|uniref:Uncharacterized protein n=2 Tax=Dehalococcoides mccartyi TaxID=61435 RepID=A0A142VDV0_9CHLR|nr:MULTISPECIES: hypothetical protein [Dehalococcoides]AII61582.1 hypothetical protein X794_07245 [Dehalococcoides mccartyi CG5]AMU87385.1 hypothetical protein Dm11a5_1559 [Dehalococcoides mccartyi]PKH44937.1 hypothetical protein KKB3_01445 [Dehalococcoides mccartyi]PKH47199.1 hypothetical protein CVH13_00687 [Dehalococcoides mccartyi]RAL69912.1 hypothetical protein C1G87_0054 [Dehalococcoides mccartyi]